MEPDMVTDESVDILVVTVQDQEQLYKKHTEYRKIWESTFTNKTSSETVSPKLTRKQQNYISLALWEQYTPTWSLDSPSKGSVTFKYFRFMRLLCDILEVNISY